MAPSILGQVNKILPQSFVDGPGNRSVIFLQGCNFQCLYCHNPYTIQLCNACGLCVAACPVGALTLVEEEVYWDSSVCVACEACMDLCPNLSSPRIHVLTPQETWGKVKPNLPFIAGVTLTGGEPTQQPEFLRAFLELVKAESALNTCIETNGKVAPDVLAGLVLYLDFAMVDLKAMDPAVHQTVTGQDNAQTLDTIRVLAHAEKLHMVRTTIVPWMTDSVANVTATARFLAELDPLIHLRLLKFRPHGTRGIAAGWDSPADEVMDNLVAAARAAGLQHVDRSL